MMTALVLICSLAKTPHAMDCGADNAVDVLRVPGEYSSLVVCFTRAQAFVGESRYELAADHYLKVVCGKPRLPTNVGWLGAKTSDSRPKSCLVQRFLADEQTRGSFRFGRFPAVRGRCGTTAGYWGRPDPIADIAESTRLTQKRQWPAAPASSMCADRGPAAGILQHYFEL
jgi:hypothetical protein